MKVRTNIRPAAILRARGLGDSDRARVFLANEVARLSDPYVPMQQGTLKTPGRLQEMAEALPIRSLTRIISIKGK